MRLFVALLASLLVLQAVAATNTLDVVQNDANSGGDAGDEAALATELSGPGGSADGRYTGFLAPVLDEQDWYSFEVTNASAPIGLRASFPLTYDVPLDACVGTNPDLSVGIRVSLVDPNGVERDSGVLGACIPHVTLGVASAGAAGTWRLAFAWTDGLDSVHLASQGRTAMMTLNTGLEIPSDYGFDLECHPWC